MSAEYPSSCPLFDIEDRMTLPVSALWGGFPEPIQRASRRYAADAVLAGRVYRGETGLWKARWTLFGDLTREFRTSGESFAETVAEGMHEVADRFAARFAMRGASAASSRVPITVEGVEASIDIVEDGAGRAGRGHTDPFRARGEGRAGRRWPS